MVHRMIALPGIDHYLRRANPRYPASGIAHFPVSMFPSLLLKGFLLGWSVAWPPGPISAEMVRRGLERGFLPAWALGLGACSGDFLWAVAVSLGAGALVDVPGVRPVLGVVSVGLLLFLAWTFGRGAWVAWRVSRTPGAHSAAVPARRFDSTRGGFVLGLTMALTSPWNIAFWLGVIGSQAGSEPLRLAASLMLAAAVVFGAASWSFVLCSLVQMGARFATPAWQIVTQGATAALMLYWAVHTVLRLAGGA